MDKHVTKAEAKLTIDRLVSSGKIQTKKRVGLSDRSFITINGIDYLYNRSTEMSEKLYKYVLQNIPYEPDDQVFKRIKLNTKTRVIQNCIKQS